MEFEVFKDTNDQWRWRLVARNGNILATSGEGYHNKSDCLHAIELVQDSSTAQVSEL